MAAAEGPADVYRVPAPRADAGAFGQAPRAPGAGEAPGAAARQPFNAPAFNLAFSEFLMNFTLDGNPVYRTQIREMDLFGLKNLLNDVGRPAAATGGGFAAAGDRVSVPTLLVDLDHLRVPVWQGERAAERDDDATSSSSSQGTGATAGGHFSGEMLARVLRAQPARAVEAAERVARQVYVRQLPPAQRRALLALVAGDAAGADSAAAAAETGGNDDDDGGDGGGDDGSGAGSTDSLLRTVERLGLGVLQIEIVDRSAERRISELTAEHLERLVSVSGIVVQASKPRHKLARARLRCRKCRAEVTAAAPPWRATVDVPRFCASGGGLGEAERCPPDPFVILNDRSLFVDAQSVKLQELPENVATGDMPKRVLVQAVGAFAGRVAPGDRVKVVGVYTTFGGRGDAAAQPVVHALGLSQRPGGLVAGGGRRLKSWDAAREEFFRSFARQPDVHARIFASIAPSLVGLDDIKRSVACLLFGGARKRMPDGSRVRADMNILLLGDPSTAKSQFLKFVERVAPVAVFTSGKGSSAAGLTAAVVRDGQGNFALEGGAMVLADLGVVCIDEFDKMGDADRVAIHEAMEQQTISLSKAGITTVLNTRCSVLAAANPTFGSYDPHSATAEQHDFETTILSRFDLIWLVRDRRNAEQDRKVASHVFKLHQGGEGGDVGCGSAGGGSAGAGAGGSANGNASAGGALSLLSTSSLLHPASFPTLPQELLQQYVFYARSSCDPALSEGAAKKLENYYVEVRAATRGQSAADGQRAKDRVPITVRQLESLVRTSEALAKMALAPTVTEAHVEEAIRLFKLSTVEAATSGTGGGRSLEHLSHQERLMVKAAENLILSKLPVFGRTSKALIMREMQNRGINAAIAAHALKALIARNLLEERGDATVRRVQ